LQGRAGAPREARVFPGLGLARGKLGTVFKKTRDPRETGDPVTFTLLDSRLRGNDDIAFAHFETGS
jgi:hypothetical protein